MADVPNYSLVAGYEPEESRDFAILATLGLLCLGIVAVIWMLLLQLVLIRAFAHRSNS
jgi:hypothetical protein